MGTLQSRLDAEFLLAHMCSVKFKEWIVVLATLLRRSEVPLPLTVHTSLVALCFVVDCFTNFILADCNEKHMSLFIFFHCLFFFNQFHTDLNSFVILNSSPSLGGITNPNGTCIGFFHSKDELALKSLEL